MCWPCSIRKLHIFQSMLQRWCFFLISKSFQTASSHSYCTRSVSNGLIFKRLDITMRYGNKSIINSTVSTLNYFQTIFHGHMLRNMSPKNWNSLFLITFLRTLNNSLCVFTIIVNKYVIGIYIYTYIYIYMYIYITYIYIHICMYM